MKIFNDVPILLLLGLLLVSCQPEAEAPAAEAGVNEVEVIEEVVIEPEIVVEDTAVPPTEAPPPAPTELPPTEVPPTTAPEPTVAPEVAPNRIATEGLFTLVSKEPVIRHNDTEAAPMKLTFPGAVVYHDGLFHMFHNELEWWPSQVHVFYSTSPDGINWTRVSDEPLFLGEDLSVPYTAFVSSVLVEDDGTWILYYYTVDNAVTWETMTEGSIGRATAPTPTGPWTADDEMVLVAGDDNAWDSYCVQNPTVLRTDQGYVMYYTGYSDRQAAIGMATSTDGIQWTKQEEPILGRSGESGTWDNAFMIDPQVVLTPDGWVMLYSRSNKVGKHGPYGFAVSSDGVNWIRSDAPIADASTVGPFIWAAELIHHDDTYYVFVESGQVSGAGQSFSDTSSDPNADWNIYLLTHEGSLIQ